MVKFQMNEIPEYINQSRQEEEQKEDEREESEGEEDAIPPTDEERMFIELLQKRTDTDWDNNLIITIEEQKRLLKIADPVAAPIRDLFRTWSRRHFEPAVYVKPNFQLGLVVNHWQTEGYEYPDVEYVVPGNTLNRDAWLSEDERQIMEIVTSSPLRARSGIKENMRSTNKMLPSTEIRKRTLPSRETDARWMQFLQKYNKAYDAITKEAFRSEQDGERNDDEPDGNK